jgi:serine/threonine protein kinase
MKKIKILGKGTFGIVYLYDKDGSKIAVKKYLYTSKKEVSYQVIREVCLMRRMQHDNVIKFLNVEINGFNIELHMEYGGVDSLKYAKSISYEKRVQLLPTIIEQLMNGCEYLHKNCIMHRDLKPENVLLQDIDGKLKLKICDFGLSKRMHPYKHDKNTNTICTSWYKPPEVFAGNYSYNVDIWSAGCIFYEFVTLNILFFGNSEIEILTNILLSVPVRERDLEEIGLTSWKIENCNQTDFYQLPTINFTDADIEFNFHNLIKKILVINPARRFSFCHFPEKTSIQIEKKPRNHDINKLIQTALKKEVNKQTLLLAVNLFDRLYNEYNMQKYIDENVSCQKNKKVKESLEIVQLCCLTICSKLIDFKPLQIVDFSEYGKIRMINYERFILDIVKFNVETYTQLDRYYEENYISDVIIDKDWDFILSSL